MERIRKEEKLSIHATSSAILFSIFGSALWKYFMPWIDWLVCTFSHFVKLPLLRRKLLCFHINFSAYRFQYFLSNLRFYAFNFNECCSNFPFYIYRIDKFTDSNSFEMKTHHLSNTKWVAFDRFVFNSSAWFDMASIRTFRFYSWTKTKRIFLKTLHHIQNCARLKQK